MALVLEHGTIDRTLTRLIESEYREMPGLSLTLAQASRLWQREPLALGRALGSLTRTGFLRIQGDCYVRADGGPRRRW